MQHRHRKDGEHDWFVPHGYALAEQAASPRMTLLVSDDEFLCSRRTSAESPGEAPLGSGVMLRIDRRTYACSCESSSARPEFARQMVVAAILGVVQRRNEGFLVVVTEAAFVGKVRGESVFGARGAELLPFELQASWAGRSRCEAVAREVRSIEHTLSTAGFYFSYGVDLSLPIGSPTDTHPACHGETGFSDQFCWNREMSEDLRALCAPYDGEWCAALINGSVQADRVDLGRDGKMANVALVARRSRLGSWAAGGGRSAVGLDEDGNASGLVATQLVVELDAAVASLEVRAGS